VDRPLSDTEEAADVFHSDKPCLEATEHANVTDLVFEISGDRLCTFRARLLKGTFVNFKHLLHGVGTNFVEVLAPTSDVMPDSDGILPQTALLESLKAIGGEPPIEGASLSAASEAASEFALQINLLNSASPDQLL
jgi:hypothetical protein